MDPNLSPLDQLIAARIKVRFASHSRKADVNEYPEAIQSIKSADALVGGLKTVSTRSTALAREALNDFSKQSHDLTDLIRHNAIGLDLAPDGFEDCVDVDLCVNTIAKSVDELLKLHLEFGKKWGDYRAKLQAKWTGQKSLFARAT
jgi:hypothetical protein